MSENGCETRLKAARQVEKRCDGADCARALAKWRRKGAVLWWGSGGHPRGVRRLVLWVGLKELAEGWGFGGLGRGSRVGGERDQIAGERSLRGIADEGRPSGYPGGPGGGLERRGGPARLCMGQGADGVDRLRAEPAAEFKPENQQAAAIGAGEFRVGSVFPPPCEGERCSGHCATVAAGVPSCATWSRTWSPNECKKPMGHMGHE
eukprot:s3968_g5.t1